MFYENIGNNNLAQNICTCNSRGCGHFVATKTVLLLLQDIYFNHMDSIIEGQLQIFLTKIFLVVFKRIRKNLKIYKIITNVGSVGKIFNLIQHHNKII